MSFTIPDFGPSDLLTSSKEGVRRVKTSSRPSLDDASINGKAQSIAKNVTILGGESVCFNLYTTGETLLKSVSCDGLDVSIYHGFAVGGISATGKSKNLNIGSDLSYDVFYNYVSSPDLTGLELLNYSRGQFDPSVTFDNGDECSIVITNNSGSDYSGGFAAIFDIFTPPANPFWLQSDTQLIATSEMSNYG